MKIKKFDARTEQEAIEKVKQELGLDALVLSIKTTKPKGMFAFMRSPLVEVTAAYDEKKTIAAAPLHAAVAAEKAPETPAVSAGQQQNQTQSEQVDRIVESIQAIQSLQGGIAQAGKPLKPQPTHQAVTAEAEKFGKQPDFTDLSANAAITADSLGIPLSVKSTPKAPAHNHSEAKLRKQAEKIKSLEQKLYSAEDMLATTMQKLSVAQHTNNTASERKYDNNLLQIFYSTLTEQGVDKTIAEELLSDVEKYEMTEVEVIVKVVYSKIVKLLGSAQLINVESAKRGNPVVIAFIGPTGVGKTTTIAKLSSLFILGLNKKVGLITADTYRIAAVEQLKTYGEILGAPVMTAYNKADVSAAVKKLSKDCEIIIIDTAGRSHKHKENVDELRQMLDAAPKSVKYLVLSTTTKCEDILSIIDLYANITDFHVIFTKLDETNCLGAILNACYVSGKKVSYVTTGQNVPDDIEVMQPEKIARALLGFGTI